MLLRNPEQRKLLAWRRDTHNAIVDICIALASATVELPSYPLLWIVDWLPHVATRISELRKIRLIERVQRACQRRVAACK